MNKEAIDDKTPDGFPEEASEEEYRGEPTDELESYPEEEEQGKPLRHLSKDEIKKLDYEWRLMFDKAAHAAQMKEAVKAYVERRWHVIPLHTMTRFGCSCRSQCGKPAKHPAVAHGTKDSRNDIPTALEWWTNDPDANIGICTGAKSGLVVLDVDPKNGGDETLKSLEDKHGKLPVTPTVQTGGGGWHYYFRYPACEIHNSAGKLGPGLDIRGEGGYAIAPPSLHLSEKRYKWTVGLDTPLADLPRWIIERIVPAGKPVSQEPANAGRIPNGKRNDTLMRIGGAMRHWGCGLESISTALGIENVERCETPLSDDEVDQIANSVCRYPPAVQDEPRIVLKQPLFFEPFPVEVIPEPMRAYITDGAKAIGCDTSYIALPLLAGLACVIGNARQVRLKNTWSEPPILWTAIVGLSGTTKSPALDLALRPLMDMEDETLRRFKQELEMFQVEQRQYELTIKKRSKPEIPSKEPPVRPVANRLITNDPTIEALARLLADSPKGVLVVRDELAGWLDSFDAYKGGRGGDAAKWLELHRAGILIIDRRSDDGVPLYVRPASVCVTGGIQPSVLRRALRPEYFGNGLAARLLFAMPPKHAKRWTEQDIDPALYDEIERVFRLLRKLSFQVDGDRRAPKLIPLTEPAQATFIGFVNTHGEETASFDSEELAAAWTKLEAYAARFALVLHLVKTVANPGGPATEDAVDEDAVRAGIRLADWFGHEAKRIYARLSEDGQQVEDRKLLEFIQRQGGRVTVRDLERGPQKFRGKGGGEKAEAALQEFVDAGYGAWQEVPSATDGGRPTKQFVLETSGDSDKTGS